MAINVNFVGRLGKDAEAHDTKSNGKFATYTVAVDEYNQETKQNDTVWVRVIDWSERTLNMLQYLKKGTLIYVVGSLKTSIYEGKNGSQVSNDVRAYYWDFVRSGKREEGQSTDNNVQQPQVAVPTPTAGTFTPPVFQTPTTGTFMPPMAQTVSANGSNTVDDLPF